MKEDNLFLKRSLKKVMNTCFIIRDEIVYGRFVLPSSVATLMPLIQGAGNVAYRIRFVFKICIESIHYLYSCDTIVIFTKGV